MWQNKHWLGFIWCSFLLVWGATACTAVPAPAVIQLSQLEPLPSPPATEVEPLRLAIAAIISPQGTADSYEPLRQYLSQALNRPVELIQRRTYAEVNTLLQMGEVDLAFVCTSAYVQGEREFGLKLLVAPQVQGDTVYHSLLLVPADSPAKQMSDLRGAVFAFTDPISTSGHNYPVFLLQQLHTTPEQFFQRFFFTYSHDDAIHAVANHVADGAAVDSLVYNYAISREPELKNSLKLIHQSPPFAIPPVVVSPHLPAEMVSLLETIFLQMHLNPAGQQTINSLGIEKFVVIQNEAYDTVRELEQLVQPPTLWPTP